jgi:DNA-binding Lrp family transcriptional regulator
MRLYLIVQEDQERKRKAMKDVEWRLIAELMKNSRRSDRELAKVLGVSQPTISRTIKKLEKEGYIKEYTMIPDFSRLGFQMLSFTFAKLRKLIPEGSVEQRREQVRETLRKNPLAEILAMSGMGLGADRIIVNFHENYSAYTRFMDFIKDHPLVDVGETSSFIVNLADESHFRTLTLSELANYLLKTKKKE